ncbi:ribosomal-processing cysteine protease Prp [Streptomyces liangshanensis]|uniref:ribosomal-processing cysteine protease Prp n=1 Tax=Streptomyces liangshanensis TaxID=2717324 RepID=UPI0036DCD6DE
MINIIAELANGRFRLDVEGHEGHAEAGRVCAAVSAITQTALLGLEAVAQQHPDLVSVTIQQE